MQIINTTFDQAYRGMHGWCLLIVPTAGFLLRKIPRLGLVHWDWTGPGSRCRKRVSCLCDLQVLDYE